MTGWGVHTIADVVGTKNAQHGLPNGRWVRAVHEPYDGNRIWAAWEVLRGRAVAFRWPTSEELADAMDR